LFPTWDIHGCERLHVIRFDIQAGTIDGSRSREVADRRALCLRGALDSFANPFQDATVLAVTRPKPFAVGVPSEPIDEIDLGKFSAVGALGKGEPMFEVIAHIVAAKRQHGEGVASKHAGLAQCGGCCFGAAGRAEKYTMFPVKGLINERDGAW